MKGAGSNAIAHCPVNRTFKHISVIIIQSENKAPVDHDAQVVQAANGLRPPVRTFSFR
jgi:hypothetical protein